RGHLLDRLPLLGWAYESKHDALIRRHKSGGAGHSEIGDHIWILVQSLVDPILQLMHLRRRRTFARNEGAKDYAAIARRQERFGNENEQDDRAGEADDPDHWRYPAML